jgi:hypothetical protein
MYALPIILALPCDLQARADEPIVSDRPDFTESSETICPGRVQLEMGFTFTQVDQVKGYSFGEVLARIGAGPDWEVRVGLNSYSRSTVADEEVAAGLEDMSLGAKYRLLAGEGAKPTSALIVGVGLPTGSSKLGVDRPQPEAVLALAWDLYDWLSLGSNLGYAYSYDGQAHFDQQWGGVALGAGIGAALGLYLEWFGFTEEEGDGPGLSYLDGGFTYLLSPDVQLDARAGIGINGRDEDYQLGVGLVVRH